MYSCTHDHVCDHYSAASLPIGPHLKCIPHATLHHPLLDKDQQDTLFIFQQLGSMFCSSVWSLPTAEKVRASSNSTSSSGKPSSLLNGIALWPIRVHTDAPTIHTRKHAHVHTHAHIGTHSDTFYTPSSFLTLSSLSSPIHHAGRYYNQRGNSTGEIKHSVPGSTQSQDSRPSRSASKARTF